MKIISTNELLQMLKESNVKLLDIRQVEYYNGWETNKNIRGGHIKGAKSIPFKWFNHSNFLDIVKNKNIEKEDSIIIYGSDKKQIHFAGSKFIEYGFKNITLYYVFEDEWISNIELPINKLTNYKHLVYPKWLNNLIKYPNNLNFVICHTHYNDLKDYSSGHIPGSIELNTNILESPDTWNIRNPKELKENLEALGITYNTMVILYGQASYSSVNDNLTSNGGGHLGAYRSALILMYAGVKDVRILNGGLQLWKDEGFDIEFNNNPKKPVLEFGVPIPQKPYFISNLNSVKKAISDKNKNLVSIRSWKEYIGETSGYSYISKKGRIPGAIFGNCGKDAYHMENYRNLDNTTKEYNEIIEQWKKVKITPEKHNIFYCGTGWRASEAFFNAWLMDWKNISVYDGGWYEWSSDKTNKIETGPL